MLKFSDESKGNVQNGIDSDVDKSAQHNLEKETLRFINNDENTAMSAEDSKGCSQVASAESLGVDNKEFSDSKETAATPRSSNQVAVTIEEKVDCTFAVGKPFVVSSDSESALPATAENKTVRAWLKDPNLYKVTSLYFFVDRSKLAYVALLYSRFS